jgi:hypothetical protein
VNFGNSARGVAAGPVSSCSGPEQSPLPIDTGLRGREMTKLLGSTIGFAALAALAFAFAPSAEAG